MERTAESRYQSDTAVTVGHTQDSVSRTSLPQIQVWTRNRRRTTKRTYPYSYLERKLSIAIASSNLCDLPTYSPESRSLFSLAVVEVVNYRIWAAKRALPKTWALWRSLALIAFPKHPAFIKSIATH